jgi:hypothetical protein
MKTSVRSEDQITILLKIREWLGLQAGSSWNSKKLRLSRGRSMSSSAKPVRNYAVSVRNAFSATAVKD